MGSATDLSEGNEELAEPATCLKEEEEGRKHREGEKKKFSRFKIYIFNYISSIFEYL